MSRYRQSTCEAHEDAVVVYTGTSCPVCEFVQEKDALEEEKIDLEKQVDNLESNVAELESQVEDQEIKSRKIKIPVSKVGRRFIED